MDFVGEISGFLPRPGDDVAGGLQKNVFRSGLDVDDDEQRERLFGMGDDGLEMVENGAHGVFPLRTTTEAETSVESFRRSVVSVESGDVKVRKWRMPARDRFHEQVRNALLKDGWTITHDPLSLKFGGTDVFIDLAAERLLEAEKDGRRIAVEIKSFLGVSPIGDLQDALGQYLMYQFVLEKNDLKSELFLAIREEIFLKLFTDSEIMGLFRRSAVRLLVFNPLTEEITRWVM